jgi:hypothetical protein
VQGVHTRVVEISFEANARSALELCFEFRKSMLGGNTTTVLKLKRNSVREGTTELLNTLRSEHKECARTLFRVLGGG